MRAGRVALAVLAWVSLVAALYGAARVGAADRSGLPPRAVSGSAGAPDRALLDAYCVGCHNARLRTGGLALDDVDLADAGAHAATLEEVVRKLRGHLMPPPGARRPPPAEVDRFVASLEGALDAAAEARPNPGRVPLHRLNRAEYAAAIRDLLGVTIDAAALLPRDDEADGFDNVASALSVSPSFLEQYIAAARAVTALALGNPVPRPASVSYRPARGTDQAVHVEGLPLGTRGGLLVEHLFPAAGEYRLNIGGLAGAGYVRGMEYAHTLIVSIDGVRVFQETIGGERDLKAIDQQQAPAVAAINARFQNIPIRVAAGPHRVGVAFVARTFAESDDVLHAFRPGAGEDRIPRVGSLEIVGPFEPAGVGDTPSRRRIFVCRPPAGASRRDEEACASLVLSHVARRAFRRPLDDGDLAAPMAFYRQGREAGDFESGIRSALPAILASPKFLYRAERTPAGAAPRAVHRLTDLELASRLSFFLSGGLPDDELLDAAGRGALSDPRALEVQVRRLLADPRASSLVTRFAFQWLKLNALDEADPDAVVFPNFDDSLREAFRRELELFVGRVFRDDRSVLDLLTADYTYVNERLARHYGIAGVRGPQFRRVVLEDPNRWGLLGKGGILTVTSYANRTAPVLRGAWILENLLGTPPAAPPPDVEGFPENRDGEKARSVREIMEQHRARPACGSCHGVMDPLGFALEHFDAIGEWRDVDRWAGVAIDASGRLADGTEVAGPMDLRRALVRRPDQFVQAMTEKLMTYALGRRVEYSDMPAIRRIVREAAREEYRFSALVMGIVRSEPFRMRVAEGQ